ncbi:MAG: arsenate reductase (azurin) large subunit [Myxococcales bacterium]|nr:arsenate reductase (azurin) large subunit [Myxococcales bacterium]
MTGDDERISLPIPPRDATVQQTVCQYCTVGCGYTVYAWPLGRTGGPDASDNAFGIDLNQQQNALTGLVYTKSMHAIVQREGRPSHVAIVPAADSPINRTRDHSSRGGANALTTFAKNRPTRDRLTTPLMRIGGQLQPVTWDEAIEVLARVIGGVRNRFGADALTAKAFDHGGGGGGFENNYAIGKLFFTGLGMKHVAIHNRPAYNSEVWGSRDRGVHELHYTAEDARLCDTLVLWGANSYETATAFFTSHMLPNLRGETLAEKHAAFAADEAIEPTRFVVVDPRATATVNVGRIIDDARVLHLRPNLGTDVVLADAIARVVFEHGWHDKAMLEARTAKDTFAAYAERSLQQARPLAAVLADAERITGVPVAQMEQAAEWMASPKGTHRRRTLTIYEKGLIWNQRNHDTIAAIVQLSVLAGHIGRPGTGCGRQGGHQEGYARPGYPGSRPPVNVDEYLLADKGKLFWVIGTNPYRTTLNAQSLRKKIAARTQWLDAAMGTAGEPSEPAARADAIVAALTRGPGLFMVVNELYLTETAADAHLVLPAAGWGEAELTSINCNSRLLRLYDRFMDPPGVARPDWAIMAATARALGLQGFDWKTPEAVFLAAAEVFPDNRVDEIGAEALPVETYTGVTYAFLRQRGQQGIQTPVRRDPKTGELIGTVRRYTHRFGTPDGLFRWHGSDPWDGFPKQVARYLTGERAKAHPFWLTTGRNQTLWQTGYHDVHLEQKMSVVPYPYVELHPDDARALAVTTGDLVELHNDEGNAVFAVRVTEATRPGLLFALQFHPRGTANALISAYTDPKTTIPWYKGTRVGLRKLRGRVPDTASGLDTHRV